MPTGNLSLYLWSSTRSPHMQGNNINPNGTGATLAAPASQYQGRAGLSPAFMKPYTRRKVTGRRVSSTPSTNRAQWDCTHGLAEEATGMEKAWGAVELAPERGRCAELLLSPLPALCSPSTVQDILLACLLEPILTFQSIILVRLLHYILNAASAN